MNKINKDIKLALETGVMGGSLCIFNDCREIACWEGSAEISKSEDVLQAIEKTLKENIIEKERIKQVIISVKPGSLTGLRIGRSIALGLKNALCSDIKEVFLLEKLLELSRDCKVLAAVPVGRNKISWLSSENTTQNYIRIGNIDLLKKDISGDKIEKLLLHRNLINEFKFDFNPAVEDIGLNMARYLN